MSEAIESNPASPTRKQTVEVAALTVLLVALGDLLLFEPRPGVNLFAFTVGIAAVLAGLAAGRRPRPALLALTVAVVLALPLIETASVPGLLLAGLGLAAATLVIFRLMPHRPQRIPGVLLRFGLLAPFRLPRDILTRRPASGQGPGQRLVHGLLPWTLPAGLSFVFLMLFAAANPLIEAAFSAFHADTVFSLLHPIRLAFWLLLATGVWALLRPALLRRRRSRLVAGTPLRVEPSWFGHAAILRSLAAFNVLFAVQTGLDLTYLWGGVALPNDMSYAQYAHRGAYPLIVTALLAAGFVLAAMRRNGPGVRSPLIRGLVYAWIGQNILLCLSAILRLNLYVEVYSLSELRLAAGIWMGLVASGLVLILLRIWLRRSNAWLISTNLLVLLVVFYVSALADYGALIARFNVHHSRELSGEGPPLDLRYLAELGPSVVPALDVFIGATDDRDGRHREAIELRRSLVDKTLRAPADPRSWTWRYQRLADYVATHPIAFAAETTQNHREEPN